MCTVYVTPHTDCINLHRSYIMCKFNHLRLQPLLCSLFYIPYLHSFFCAYSSLCAVFIYVIYVPEFFVYYPCNLVIPSTQTTSVCKLVKRSRFSLKSTVLCFYLSWIKMMSHTSVHQYWFSLFNGLTVACHSEPDDSCEVVCFTYVTCTVSHRMNNKAKEQFLSVKLSLNNN